MASLGVFGVKLCAWKACTTVSEKPQPLMKCSLYFNHYTKKKGREKSQLSQNSLYQHFRKWDTLVSDRAAVTGITSEGLVLPERSDGRNWNSQGL